MRWILAFSLTLLAIATTRSGKQSAYEVDEFSSSAGIFKITCIGHGTLMIEFAGKVIHVDPVSEFADYSKLPKADLILITHEHGDHLDMDAVQLIKKDNTVILCSEKCTEKLPGGIIIRNGEEKTVLDIPIQAVAAYNLLHKRQNGSPYHPKGSGNGYVLTCGDKKIYIAGDTENIPEMKKLSNIDIAFLPMNLPYTMTPEMVAAAAQSFAPKILYPYHFGDTDVNKLQQLLSKSKNIEIRIRKLK